MLKRQGGGGVAQRQSSMQDETLSSSTQLPHFRRQFLLNRQSSHLEKPLPPSQSSFDQPQDAIVDESSYHPESIRFESSSSRNGVPSTTLPFNYYNSNEERQQSSSLSSTTSSQTPRVRLRSAQIRTNSSSQQAFNPYEQSARIITTKNYNSKQMSSHQSLSNKLNQSVAVVFKEERSSELSVDDAVEHHQLKNPSHPYKRGGHKLKEINNQHHLEGNGNIVDVLPCNSKSSLQHSSLLPSTLTEKRDRSNGRRINDQMKFYGVATNTSNVVAFCPSLKKVSDHLSAYSSSLSRPTSNVKRRPHSPSSRSSNSFVFTGKENKQTKIVHQFPVSQVIAAAATTTTLLRRKARSTLRQESVLRERSGKTSGQSPQEKSNAVYLLKKESRSHSFTSAYTNLKRTPTHGAGDNATAVCPRRDSSSSSSSLIGIQCFSQNNSSSSSNVMKGMMPSHHKTVAIDTLLETQPSIQIGQTLTSRGNIIADNVQPKHTVNTLSFLKKLVHETPTEKPSRRRQNAIGGHTTATATQEESKKIQKEAALRLFNCAERLRLVKKEKNITVINRCEETVDDPHSKMLSRVVACNNEVGEEGRKERRTRDDQLSSPREVIHDQGRSSRHSSLNCSMQIHRNVSDVIVQATTVTNSLNMKQQLKKGSQERNSQVSTSVGQSLSNDFRAGRQASALNREEVLCQQKRIIEVLPSTTVPVPLVPQLPFESLFEAAAERAKYRANTRNFIHLTSNHQHTLRHQSLEEDGVFSSNGETKRHIAIDFDICEESPQPHSPMHPEATAVANPHSISFHREDSSSFLPPASSIHSNLMEEPIDDDDDYHVTETALSSINQKKSKRSSSVTLNSITHQLFLSASTVVLRQER